jgi:hypothetical protein
MVVNPEKIAGINKITRFVAEFFSAKSTNGY